MSGLLAHQGGWDEILFVLAPLVLFAALLLLARRRVDRMDATEAAARNTDPSTEPDDAEPR